MNSADQITQMLTIVLIVMIVVLVILAGAFLFFWTRGQDFSKI